MENVEEFIIIPSKYQHSKKVMNPPQTHATIPQITLLVFMLVAYVPFSLSTTV